MELSIRSEHRNLLKKMSGLLQKETTGFASSKQGLKKVQQKSGGVNEFIAKNKCVE
jgi:hypothetical protein